MRKNLCIIDYIGNSDSKGNPIGHPIKVINEYSELLKNDIDISLVIPKNYQGRINLKNIHHVIWLEFYMDITAKNLFKKLKNILGRIYNVISSLKNKEDEILWYINIDFILLMILTLYPVKKSGKKIWITTYIQEYTEGSVLKNKIKNFFYFKGINKIDKIITSNHNLKFAAPTIFLPDYFYDPQFYNKYLEVKKKKQVLCIGTINNSKDIEGVVGVFSHIDLPLKIIGKFHDREMYNKLVKNASPNILIKDQYLSEDDYYTLIAESLFVILPYKQESYSERTSGVLLETVFLNSIPIAPWYLLKFNAIDGIGYNDLSEIISILKSSNLINESSNESKKNEYDINFIKRKILQLII
jgi:glycosyltransferase involved in cell wall biosynthesis